VGINQRIFDGFGHGFVTDLMHWLHNWEVLCVHRASRYFLLFFKDSAHAQRIKSSCISALNCLIKTPLITL